MENNKSYKLIITVVNFGFADDAIREARAAGATGATVLKGRGSAPDDETFMGIAITPEKETVLTVVKAEITLDVMQRLADKLGKGTPARGVSFCLPVDYLTKLNTEEN